MPALSLAGGIWLLWLLDYQLSAASGVGFIALAVYLLLLLRRRTAGKK